MFWKKKEKTAAQISWESRSAAREQHIKERDYNLKPLVKEFEDAIEEVVYCLREPIKKDELKKLIKESRATLIRCREEVEFIVKYRDDWMKKEGLPISNDRDNNWLNQVIWSLSFDLTDF
jgi:hypothetical protein